MTQTRSTDPLARPGDRWLGDICPQQMTARTDAHCQLEDCCAGAATDVEYAFTRLGSGQIQQLLGQRGNRTIHPLVLVGPRPRGGAVPKFNLRGVRCSRFMLCHRGPLELSISNKYQAPATIRCPTESRGGVRKV